MLNSTEAARKAFATMNERFEVLQAVQRKMKPLRDAGMPISAIMFDEWEAAYQQFQAAHEEWKRLATPLHPSSRAT